MVCAGKVFTCLKIGWPIISCIIMCPGIAADLKQLHPDPGTFHYKFLYLLRICQVVPSIALGGS